MKNLFPALPILLLCFSATLSPLHAQEAWLLEMPNKYSDYLIKKSIAGDYDTVAGIIEKIPDLIAAKQIREIELITWKAEEGGKIHPKKKIVDENGTFNAGSRYYPNRSDSLDHRKITITPETATQRHFKIDAIGTLARDWTPTFIHKRAKLSIILLERHPEAGSANVPITDLRQLQFDTTTKEHVAWYSSLPLDTRDLSYQSRAALAANPKIKFGTNIFTTVHKDANTLLRIEANSKDTRTPDFINLHHNEAQFKGHTQTTGPLKKERLKIADKSYTTGDNKGTWTLTLRTPE